MSPTRRAPRYRDSRHMQGPLTRRSGNSCQQAPNTRRQGEHEKGVDHAQPPNKSEASTDATIKLLLSQVQGLTKRVDDLTKVVARQGALIARGHEEHEILLKRIYEPDRKLEANKELIDLQHKRLGEQQTRIEVLEHRCSWLGSRLDTAMTSTVLPVVATVVLKAQFKKGMNINSASITKSMGANIIRRNRSRYRDFGLHSEVEMLDFANAWEDVIPRRNNAAHEVKGDDVINALSYARPYIHRVLCRAFFVLWGIAVHNWHLATDTQKNMTVRNISDSELAALGL